MIGRPGQQSPLNGRFFFFNFFFLTITRSGLLAGIRWFQDYREAEELSWCPSWSNSLWQGWSCRLVHCPRGNATNQIWRVLASSDEISSWTPLKPQHSNPNELWCIDFLTPPTPLIIPYRLPATQKLMLDSCKMLQKQSEAFHTFLWHFFQV